MTRALTTRELNRALLARQLLLKSSTAADQEVRDEGAGLVRFMEPTPASYAVERRAADLGRPG